MESTDESAWRVGAVRSADGRNNCFFGRLCAMGGEDKRGSQFWVLFEEIWATTYMVYPFNDGKNPGYRSPG